MYRSANVPKHRGTNAAKTAASNASNDERSDADVEAVRKKPKDEDEDEHHDENEVKEEEEEEEEEEEGWRRRQHGQRAVLSQQEAEDAEFIRQHIYTQGPSVGRAAARSDRGGTGQSASGAVALGPDCSMGRLPSAHAPLCPQRHVRRARQTGACAHGTHPCVRSVAPCASSSSSSSSAPAAPLVPPSRLQRRHSAVPAPDNAGAMDLLQPAASSAMAAVAKDDKAAPAGSAPPSVSSSLPGTTRRQYAQATRHAVPADGRVRHISVNSASSATAAQNVPAPCVLGRQPVGAGHATSCADADDRRRQPVHAATACCACGLATSDAVAAADGAPPPRSSAAWSAGTHGDGDCGEHAGAPRVHHAASSRPAHTACSTGDDENTCLNVHAVDAAIERDISAMWLHAHHRAVGGPDELGHRDFDEVALHDARAANQQLLAALRMFLHELQRCGRLTRDSASPSRLCSAISLCIGSVAEHGGERASVMVSSRELCVALAMMRQRLMPLLCARHDHDHDHDRDDDGDRAAARIRGATSSAPGHACGHRDDGGGAALRTDGSALECTPATVALVHALTGGVLLSLLVLSDTARMHAHGARGDVADVDVRVADAHIGSMHRAVRAPAAAADKPRQEDQDDSVDAEQGGWREHAKGSGGSRDSGDSDGYPDLDGPPVAHPDGPRRQPDPSPSRAPRRSHRRRQHHRHHRHA